MQNGIIVVVAITLVVGSAFVYLFSQQETNPLPSLFTTSSENAPTLVAPGEAGTETAPTEETKATVSAQIVEDDKRSIQGLTIPPKLSFSHALLGHGIETVYVSGIPDTIFKGMQSGANFAQQFSLHQNGVQKYLLDGVVDLEEAQRANGSYKASVFFWNSNLNAVDNTISPGLYTLQYEVFSMLPAGKFELKRVSEFKVSSKIFAWPFPTCKISVIPATPYANEEFTLKWTSSNATGTKWLGEIGSAKFAMTLLGLNSTPLAISGVATKIVTEPQDLYLTMQATNANGDINNCSFSFSVIASTTAPQ